MVWELVDITENACLAEKGKAHQTMQLRKLVLDVAGYQGLAHSPTCVCLSWPEYILYNTGFIFFVLYFLLKVSTFLSHIFIRSFLYFPFWFIIFGVSSISFTCFLSKVFLYFPRAANALQRSRHSSPETQWRCAEAGIFKSNIIIFQCSRIPKWWCIW